MALTEFQRTVCRLIARRRVESGVSYVAGGVALNALTGAPRVSRDIDVFHDTVEAVASSWDADRAVLEQRGFGVTPQREREAFVEAVVTSGTDSVVLQWAADSAFRFFPLVLHDDFGLTLHPFDLATNKVLALVGRVEVRDWVDVIHSHEHVQRFGYLAWAACGKDPGFGPGAILEQAGRSARYSAAEVATLAFAGAPPDAADLSRRWHGMLAEARELVSLLPPDRAGQCVLDVRGDLFAGDPVELRGALAAGAVGYHEGRLRGALPQTRDPRAG